jgi:putative ATPase
MANETGCRYVQFSAVLSGVKEVRAVVAQAEAEARGGIRTILFVDEIHRFNKAQQDAFLPHVESGLLTLIGATTENPSFEVNAALLSRCRVFTFEALSDDDLSELVDRVFSDAERGLGGRGLELTDEARSLILRVANGDARSVLNVLEMAANAVLPDDEAAVDGDPGAGEARGGNGAADAEGVTASFMIDADLVRDVCQSGRHLLFDKGGEEHYNIISALHKSIRGSDPQAALYWLARILEAGGDPLYVARRLIRIASEDVGNADPQALPLTVAARDAAHMVGLPECKLAMAQAVTYLATAPKSNALETAYGEAARDALETRADPVPLHIRNAPTRLMKDLAYGRDYQYDHAAPDGYAGQEFLPEALTGREYYRPVERGFEREIRRRIAYWARLKEERRGTS